MGRPKKKVNDDEIPDEDLLDDEDEEQEEDDEEEEEKPEDHIFKELKRINEELDKIRNTISIIKKAWLKHNERIEKTEDNFKMLVERE